MAYLHRSTQFNGIAVNSVVFVFLLLNLSGCSKTTHTKNEIRFILDSAPATLNPRSSLDAVGQRIEMLTFRSLTRLNENLDPVGDLSEKWRYDKDGKQVRFTVNPGNVDHLGRAITAKDLYECMQNYLFREPVSIQRSSFPELKSVTLDGNDLVFTLGIVDPYLPKNLSVLRYFTTEANPQNPCIEPKAGERMVTNGIYEVVNYTDRFDRELRLQPREQGAPVLVMELVRDEISRILKLLNGEANVALSCLSPSKGDWLARERSDAFRITDRVGTNTSYLAFNLKDPILSKRDVRKAIAHAIDRESIVKFKLKGQASLASSFLNPSLSEAAPFIPFTYDPELSGKLLDQAGYPKNANGFRFKLTYKTTTNRENLELAQVYQEMLKKIGIDVEIDSVEISVFFASIRKGNFQFYSSRWVGVSDGSIYERTLRSKSKTNITGYLDPMTDSLLSQAGQELDPAKRHALLIKIQERMLTELPYFPLWHWSNTLITAKTLQPLQPELLSLSGSYISLPKLRFQTQPDPK
jgi:peptide/nickel transport system substrate-binding protein